jgi:hypothetical protein
VLLIINKWRRKGEAMKKILQKLVISGNVIRVVSYEKPIAVHFSRGWCAGQDAHPKDSPEEIQKSCDRRAHAQIARIINSYFYRFPRKCFFTLTYHRIQRDRTETRIHLHKLFKHFNIGKKNPTSWLAVTELQDRGAIHVHGIMNEYIRWIKMIEIWQMIIRDDGGVWLEKCEENTNIGTYITKYLLKDPQKQGRRKGERRFWKSKDVRDLSTSFEFEAIHDWGGLFKEMDKPFSFSYETKYNGLADGFSGCYHNPGEIHDIAHQLSTEGY